MGGEGVGVFEEFEIDAAGFQFRAVAWLATGFEERADGVGEAGRGGLRTKGRGEGEGRNYEAELHLAVMLSHDSVA